MVIDLDFPRLCSMVDGLGTTNYSYTAIGNDLNQLDTWETKTYAYDADGNTLSGDGTRTYKWDAENRLVEINYVGSTAKSEFSYDGLGHPGRGDSSIRAGRFRAEAFHGLRTVDRYRGCIAGKGLCHGATQA
jgi:hypothetical protein